MTQVARVFVVLNLLLAVGFLFSAATILSLDNHWKEKYEAKSQELATTIEAKDKQISKITAERDDFRRANDQLKESEANVKGANSTLRQQVEQLTSDNKSKDTANNELRQSLDNLQASVDRQEKFVESLRKESKENADAARKARTESKESLASLEKARQTIRQRDNSIADNEKTITTQKETIKQQEVMIAFARDKGINFENLVNMKPVRGNVVQADNATRLAVINRGSKQGVGRGYVLDITRGEHYVGRLQIDTVYENAAAGTIKILNKGMQVKAGDAVTNTLH